MNQFWTFCVLVGLFSAASFVSCQSKQEIIAEAKIKFRLSSGYEWSLHPKSVRFTIPDEAEFTSFESDFEKKYATTAERAKRFHHFRVNAWIAQALQANELGTAQYGTTKFSDLSVEEFQETYRNLHFDPDVTRSQDVGKQVDVDISRDIPTDFDWRNKGAVTPVKDQGNCGSCWAFSTTGNIEGQWFLKKGHLVSLSEQELVDCDHIDAGCDGGLQSDAYKAIMEIGGLETEAQYPYRAHGGSCTQDKHFAAYINSSVVLPSDEIKIAQWLVQHGPIAIGINGYAMQSYKGGISHPGVWCNKKFLDHAVLITGYGVDGGVPYWFIKNSWGADYGEAGYYRIYRGDNVCGVATNPTSTQIS